MAGPVACRASRLLPPYSGRAFARLRLSAVAAVMGMGLLSGGCAMSGLFGTERDDSTAYAKADTTGSVPAAPKPAVASNLPPEADLAYKRAAVAEVLARGAKTLSAPWENPRTGARGTVTPIASAYVQDGVTCHDFLASHVQGSAESWMQGEACRERRGNKWEVRTLRPWKRS